MQLLNFLASFALYGSLLMYAVAGLMLGYSVWVIWQAIALNRRAKRWADRLVNMPMTSNVQPWGRKAGR